jgi:hypothetical protein
MTSSTTLAASSSRKALPPNFDGTRHLKKQIADRDAIILEKDEQISNLVATVENL